MSDEIFIHPQAIVDTDAIGIGTRVWAFTHILNGAIIGQNCNIGDHCFIESEVKIGDNVVIKNGVSIWNEAIIEDLVFVGPNVVFTNDMYPRSKLFRENYIPIIIKEGASIGANATLVCGITIGKYAMIGAGAVVTKDVADFTLVAGNPAKPMGYICKCSEKLNFKNSQVTCESCGNKFSLEDGKVTLHS